MMLALQIKGQLDKIEAEATLPASVVRLVHRMNVHI